jgi:hypothetical protein
LPAANSGKRQRIDSTIRNEQSASAQLQLRRSHRATDSQETEELSPEIRVGQQHVTPATSQEDNDSGPAASAAFAVPLTKPKIAKSKIEQQMLAIDDALWPALRYGVRASGLNDLENATFAETPSRKLEELYELCFGERWKHAVGKGLAFRSLDFMVALVQAAVYSKVFCTSQPCTEKRFVTFGFQPHREAFEQVLHQQGRQ